MRLLRRIALTVVLTVGVLCVIAEWAVPVALSYYAVRKAPSIVRVIPTALDDVTISDASGVKLSYLGYAFEVPWTDLDESQTKQYPTDKTAKFRVDLHFKSGLRLLVTSVPARSLVDGLPKEFNTSPKKLAAAFGPDTMKSDYSFNQAVYEFTPDKMNHWDFRRAPVNRDELLLIIKSIVLSSSASSGIFNIQSGKYVGFQQGNPQAQPHAIVVSLYSDDGEVEMIFTQKDYRKSVGITQPEINRVIHSLRELPTQKPQIQARLGH